MSDAAVFQIIGALLMAVGIVVFLVRREQGSNTLKFVGLEASLSTPSLVVFVIGALLFIFPFTGSFQPHEHNQAAQQQQQQQQQPKATPPATPPEVPAAKPAPAVEPPPQPNINLSPTQDHAPQETEAPAPMTSRTTGKKEITFYSCMIRNPFLEIEPLLPPSTNGFVVRNRRFVGDNLVIYHDKSDRAQAEQLLTNINRRFLIWLHLYPKFALRHMDRNPDGYTNNIVVQAAGDDCGPYTPRLVPYL